MRTHTHAADRAEELIPREWQNRFAVHQYFVQRLQKNTAPRAGLATSEAVALHIRWTPTNW